MSDVKKKLSLLKVERRIKNLKGIKDVHFQFIEFTGS